MGAPAYENKYYLQPYFAYKIVNTQMVHHLGENLFASDNS